MPLSYKDVSYRMRLPTYEPGLPLSSLSAPTRSPLTPIPLILVQESNVTFSPSLLSTRASCVTCPTTSLTFSLSFQTPRQIAVYPPPPTRRRPSLESPVFPLALRYDAQVLSA